jgi:hypothetical protein
MFQPISNKRAGYCVQVTSKNIISINLHFAAERELLTFCMQNEDEQLKTTGEGRKLPGAGKHGCGRQRWWKAAVTAAAFSFLLSSPLFLFSIPSLSFVVPSLCSAPLLPLQFCWRWQR